MLMSPVVAEQEGAERRRGQGWLRAAMVALALLLLLPVVPALQPLRLRLGRTVLLAGLARAPAGSGVSRTFS